VVEIGVGFGGLCYAMHVVFDIANYSLVDLTGPYRLAKKWLNHFPETQNVTAGKPPFDITISEYAITELEFDDIIEYYNLYIKQSNGFLIRTNYHTAEDYDRFVDLLLQDFKIEVLPFRPYKKRDEICGRNLIGTRIV
jgi:hypothetical protein